MQCTSPRNAGYEPDGVTVTFYNNKISKEYVTWQVPCGKCLDCRLAHAKEWAIRSVHEAKMHEENCFITLTYDDQHLESPKLIYRHWQEFMWKLRSKLRRADIDTPISVSVVGEYGEANKRPHWHALLFGWKPKDLEYLRTSDRGDKIYKSATLEALWGKNDTDKKPNEIGEVTFESAGYVSRYNAKKLIHGKDHEHDYHPIARKSSKYAIGKKWLEQNYKDLFTHGYLVLDNGLKHSIPRYYEKWFKENHPEEYLHYVTEVKHYNIQKAIDGKVPDQIRSSNRPRSMTQNEIKNFITRKKFKQLQANLKL